MIFNEIKELNDQGKDFVIATISQVRGSAPQDLGAKCVITQDGLYAGTVGGGKIEAHVINYGQDLLKSEGLNVVNETWNLQTDIGMTCGGEVSFIFEKFLNNNLPIMIFGAGHVSQALAQILTHIKAQVTIIDPRAEWVAKLPKKHKTTITDDCEDLIKQASAKTFFISMTKGHSSDVPKLYQVYKYHPDTPYVGVIGSDVKGKKIKAELKEMGASDAFLEKLLVPIGLKCGKNDPYEIAISIVAQILQYRDKL
jgi:xanthine dehydrogenase accessory factor